MDDKSRQFIKSLFAPPNHRTIAQWAEQEIDYSRCLSYDSDWKGPYRVDYLPYLREPLEACEDMTVKEIWCWACTRGGKSENFLLTVMRWMLANCPPYAMLYIGGQQTKVEQFLEKRIIRGMQLSRETAAMLSAAKVREHTVNFGGLCDLVCSWAANKQVAKGDSFPVIFADEVSSWPGFKSDVLRERQATVPFPKLIGVSSADAESRRTSDEDPIIQEWEATDRREYMMDDPGAKGQRFQFRMGGKDTPDGVKWSPDAKRSDGTWDLDAVEATAHYVTPSGCRIEEKDRLGLLAGGVWVPTAKAPAWKRGYRVTRMMTPFPTGRFGNMARTYCEAVRKQKAGQFDDDGRSPLRVFIYERLAEKYYAEKLVPKMAEVEKRKGPYMIGQKATTLPVYLPTYEGKRRDAFMTMDVQQESIWWAVREWVHGGDSFLVDFGKAASWQELREIGGKHNIRGGLIDNSYAERRDEVIEQVTRGQMRGIILSYGRDNIRDTKGMPRDYATTLDRDPYEGTARQGQFRCHSVTFNPDRLKHGLFALISGKDRHTWRIPDNVASHYVEQMTSEQCIDGKWARVKRDNHLWDCEVLQLLCAKIYGLWIESEEMPELMKLPDAPQNVIDSTPAPVKIAVKPKAAFTGKPCPHCGGGPVINQECKSCRGGVADRRDEFDRLKPED